MTDTTPTAASAGLSVVDELAAQLQTFSIQPLKHAVENLNEQKQLEQFLHESIDSLLGHAHSFSPFTTAEGSSSFAVHLASSVDAYKHFLRLVLRDNLDESAAKQLLSVAIPSLTPDQLSTFYQIYLARRDELTQAVKSNAVTIGATLQLVDFDWSARAILSSSALSNVREGIVVLTLILATTESTTNRKSVTVELTKTQLDDFLIKAEQALKVVQDLTI